MNTKESASTFLRLTSSGKVEEAFHTYVSKEFLHHNAYFPGDSHSLKNAMMENHHKFPDKVFEIKRVIGEGDLVAVHSRVKISPGAPDVSVVHIFRFHENLIAELWDIGQTAPESSPNKHGMF